MGIEQALLISIAVYLTITFGVVLWSKEQIHTEEDFIVAGRRLPLLLSSATLLATWFGAGTILTASDEVYAEGLRVSALEPYGAGLCLILAGVFFAKPLWEMKLLTLSDLYLLRFGRKMEVLSVILVVPGYMGWIAVQLTALAGILNLFFALPIIWGILIVATIATIFTLFGGMWSVTLTDAILLILITVGVLMLGYEVFSIVSWEQMRRELPAEDMVWVPLRDPGSFMKWTGLLVVGSLGNIPGQDLTQRIFSAKSSKVARNACLISGVGYILLGTIPVLTALAARLILGPDLEHSVLPTLAREILSPAMVVVFVLALISVVISTIDSAILAPASLIARNLIRPYVRSEISTLVLLHGSVVFMAVASVMVAIMGEDTYSILESSYAIALVGMFVPLCFGLFWKNPSEKAAVTATVCGVLIWLPEVIWDLDYPLTLVATASAFLIYFAVSSWENANQETGAQEI